ncbi:MAG: aldehyde dehydrogenase family protein [Thermoleophilia bacterium]|nr:aldehyde dehydrogenase family protein [Thermoleophilia bacterium]
MGPVVHKAHQEFVLKWIETGIQEGAELMCIART